MANKRAIATRTHEAWFQRPTTRKYELCLFVSGMTPRSSDAIARIKGLCEEYLHGRYELEVIDIYQQPELAQKHQVLAVPTLIKLSPEPQLRLIGDLTDVGAVLRSLNLQAKR